MSSCRKTDEIGSDSAKRKKKALRASTLISECPLRAPCRSVGLVHVPPSVLPTATPQFMPERELAVLIR